MSDFFNESNKCKTYVKESERSQELCLGLDAKMGLAGKVLQAIEPHTESDEIAILINFLTYFGNIVGAEPYFMVQGSKVFPKLFSVIAGKSSDGRKGSSLGPINYLFSYVDEAWFSTCRKSGLSSGEGLISELASRENSSDGRLLIVEEEFGSILKVSERVGNTLSVQIRKAWDGKGELSTLTKKPLHIPSSHVSILGQITIEELNLLYNENDIYNGLLNRFIWLYVERSKFLPEGGNLHNENLVPLLNELKEAIAFAKHVGELKRDLEAKEYWAHLYYELGQRNDNQLGAIQNRAENHILRLSMIYALLDCSGYISERHILAAEEIWRYSVASLSKIFKPRLTIDAKDQEKLINKLKEKNVLTRTDVSKLYNGNKRKKEIDMIIQDLINQNIITSIKSKNEHSAKYTEYFELVRESLH